MTEHKKRPPVQLAWKEWKKLHDRNQEAIVWWQYLISLNEIVLFIIPYLLAGYWFSSNPVPKKTKKRNRNI